MRRRAKVDLNHAEIVAALRKVGWHVLSLAAVGDGCPDLLCWKGHHTPGCQWALSVPIDRCVCGGRWRLVEVKQPKGKLTRVQENFRHKWPVSIVRSLEDVVNL